MQVAENMAGINIRTLIICLTIPLTVNCLASCNSHPVPDKGSVSSGISDLTEKNETPDVIQPAYTMLVLPENPVPGEAFRIFATGGEKILKAKIIISGSSGILESMKSKTGEELPCWRIENYNGSSEGKYKVVLTVDKKVVGNLEFNISQRVAASTSGVVWKTVRGWDSSMEAIYSAWINALFYDSDEESSWPALHEVTQNQDRNFLYNYLSLGEDDLKGTNRLIMQPDCADNPFYLRAYFAWKLGLPFGYHVCDRGSLVHNPKPGKWITNEISSSKSQPVLAVNSFLRMVMNGVHSGTARTALDDENSDYYPVSLERGNLGPGIVFADPYGHTLIIVGWKAQTNDHPGLLLAVDAQPDGTVAIKRFWKGNFLFNTSGVVGEPGFKAFRPIATNNGVLSPMKNKELTVSAGFVPYSLQQRKMKDNVFYHIMDRLINPKPLDPETALLDLINALYQQLLVRVNSVANGEAYIKSNPGTVIPMPSNANGIFQAGGQWENFSTPNRDLRLLIAMDAVLDFPDLVVRSPEDFNLSRAGTPVQVKKKLQTILEQKGSELSISYTRTNGFNQKLTVGEILKRKDAFEIAYNPNDGIEVRWGAQENSDERSTCRRHCSPKQLETMRTVRSWFHKRMHPPT